MDIVAGLKSFRSQSQLELQLQLQSQLEVLYCCGHSGRIKEFQESITIIRKTSCKGATHPSVSFLVVIK